MKSLEYFRVDLKRKVIGETGKKNQALGTFNIQQTYIYRF